MSAYGMPSCPRSCRRSRGVYYHIAMAPSSRRRRQCFSPSSRTRCSWLQTMLLTDVELGRLRPAQGAVVRETSPTTSPWACRPSSPSKANSSRHRRVRGRRSNPLPLALSAALYHILSYTHSFLTAQFVLLLTVQGFSERWGGWPCFWVALATAGPAAARPWPQWWLGRSISRALLCPSGPPSRPRNRHVGVSRGC